MDCACMTALFIMGERFPTLGLAQARAQFLQLLRAILVDSRNAPEAQARTRSADSCEEAEQVADASPTTNHRQPVPGDNPSCSPDQRRAGQFGSPSAGSNEANIAAAAMHPLTMGSV